MQSRRRGRKVTYPGLACLILAVAAATNGAVVGSASGPAPAPTDRTPSDRAPSDLGPTEHNPSEHNPPERFLTGRTSTARVSTGEVSINDALPSLSPSTR